MYIVTTAQMKKIEGEAVSLGVSTLMLMENAASALKAEVLSYSPSKVLVFTGKGQNAGDGFALARRLFAENVNVEIIYVSDPEQLHADALLNFRTAKNFGVPMRRFCAEDTYDCDVIAECICGTGFHGELSEDFERAALAINQSRATVICADIPCGVNADTGETDKNAVKADRTITFGFAKRGLYSPLSADYTGDIAVAEISVPQCAADKTGVQTSLISSESVSIPKVSRAANKGTNGRVLIAGGSYGMAGAVIMAANAAQRCGAGTVTCAAPQEVALPLMSQLTGSMYTEIEKADFSKFDSVLFGNGAGRSERSTQILKKVLSDCRGTLVIDADGLNALSENVSLLERRSCDVIITPHPLEFSRLTGLPVSEILQNRVELATEFSEKYGITTVLKSAYTVVAAESGAAYINITGNEGMAKGGSGDVLAGMTAGLAPRFSSAAECARCAVYLHGLAGDVAAQRYGKLSVTPDDITECICTAAMQTEKN